MDTNDKMAVIGVAIKGEDGLFYIKCDGETNGNMDRATMAVVSTHAERIGKFGFDKNREETADRSFQERSSAEANGDTRFKLKPSAKQQHIKDADVGASKKETTQTVLWHKHLGHVGSRRDKSKLLDQGHLQHIVTKSSTCDPCEKGKFRRSFRGSLTKANVAGNIHADVVGKIDPASSEGFIYFLCIIDEYSRYAETVPLMTKGEVSDQLMKFMVRFERQTDTKLKALHTDGGSEFNKAREKFEELGLVVSTTTPYTPASNGLVERTQGVLLSHTRICLSESKLPLKYWNDALRHVSFARNAVPHAQTGVAPYVLLYNKSPAYTKHMRPFGCKALVSLNSPHPPKLSARLVEGLNLGHKKERVYKIWTSKGIMFTKHVKVGETSFPGLSDIEIENDGKTSPTLMERYGYIDDSDDESTSSVLDVPLDIVTYTPPLETTNRQPEDGAEIRMEQHDLACELTPHSYNLRPRAAVAMPQFISTIDEPSLKEAISSEEAEHWKTAIQEEFNSIRRSGVFKIMPNPPSDALPSGIVLRLKRDSAGKPFKFKARLDARGNLQSIGDTSYAERYARVACFDLVRTLFALTVEKQWATRYLDIKGAFLYADLRNSSNIWLKLPKIDGITGANGCVVKLVKSLYGLRELPKLWYKTLSNCLVSSGFTQSVSNERVFILGKNGKKVILLAYVDDLGLFGDKHMIIHVKSKLEGYFEVTDLEFIEHFLGVKFSYNSQGMMLYQTPLIQRLLKNTNMENANEAKTPLPASHVLYSPRIPLNAQETAEMKFIPYRETLGALLFLATRTRPDLSTATSMLGKHAASPGPTHWKAMKHVLRYLKGTASHGIFFAAGRGLRLQGWSDADWARDQDKRRSWSGILLTVGGNAVQWISKLQPSVALSRTESEFHALSECIRNVKWMRRFLTELEVLPQGPTSIYQDNLGTISWTDEVQGLRNVKHVGICYSYVREAVQQKEICVLHVSSVNNKADAFTKALTGKLFDDHRDSLRVASADHPSS